MAVTKVTLTGTYLDGSGSPLAGTVTFTPSAPLADSADGRIVRQKPVTATLDDSGAFSAALIATDDTAFEPSGWTWIAKEQISGLPVTQWSFALPLTGGSTQDVSALAPVSIPGVASPFLELPSGSPTAGQVPVATGTGTETEWETPASEGVQIGGDLGGSLSSPVVAKIQGTVISSPPGGTTEFLRGDGTWEIPGGGGSLPLITVGDTLYEGTGPAPARLAGNATTTKMFLSQTGTGSASAAPAWNTIAAGDVPVLNQNTTGTAAGLSATLPVSSGGTGQASQAAALTALAGTQAAGQYLRSNGTATALSAIQAGDVPALNQSTTGTAANVTGTVAIANGGTGAATQQAAMDALAGSVTSGRYLRGSGSHVTMSAPQPGDLGATASQSGYTPLLLNPATGMVWGYPWKFDLFSYGAAGNGVIVTDGAMTASGNTLTCGTSAPFTPGSVGQYVVVAGAKGAYAPLATTITGYTSATQVTLAASATATCSAAVTMIATDDTAAIQAAWAAAYSYWQAHGGTVECTVDPFIFGVAGPLITGSPTEGNSQLPWPGPVPVTGPKFPMTLKGSGDPTSLPHWQQTIPQAQGSFFMSMILGTSNGGANGPPHVIGTPVSGYGGEPGLYSNALVTIDGIGIITSYNGGIGGVDLFGAAEANVVSLGVMPAGVVPTGGSSPIPNITSTTNISNQWGWGLRMPAAGNNDNCEVGTFSVEGQCYGFGPSEHTSAKSVRAIYCITGIEAHSGNGVTMVHSGRISYASVEACTNMVGAYPTGGIRLDIDTLDGEDTGIVVYDPSSQITGTFGWRGDTANGGYRTTSPNNTASLVRLVNLTQATGPVASPHAAPATATAWLNGYYRDAWVVASLSGGTFTSLNVDAVAQPGAAGAASWGFMLPSGHSYTPSYPAGTLTHTVTLL
jgi:hypothetical protein